MLSDGQSGICMMSDEVTRDLNTGWKCVNWMMITADGNQTDLSKMTESVPVDVNGIAISMLFFL
jgi:hypothetical protein